MSGFNQDNKTVSGFGDEWERFDQSDIDSDELRNLFSAYFKIFPWETLGSDAEGFDMGCGSGRWAKLVAPLVGTLHCIDPSSAIHVAERNLSKFTNCIFHQAGVSERVLPEKSMDFGYSLGVLHHIPDTQLGIRECVRMLKPGAPFLVYLYYNLDNRNFVYRSLWKLTDYFRRVVSKLPHNGRYLVCQALAVSVYWPVARFALVLERCGLAASKVSSLPLSYYRDLSFYTMRTDALDRFGTFLEHRFSRQEIQDMLEAEGLVDVHFSETAPYWCAIGRRGVE